MPDPLQAIVERMVAAGEPEDNIALVIQQHKTTAPQPQAAPAAPPGRSWTDTAVDALPALGGIAGGIVGGIGGAVAGMGVGGVPGGIGGATLGGGAGEAAKQLINRARGAAAPASAADAATDIGVQGAIQGAGQAVGAGIGKVASKAAPWLMNRALNLTDKLSREFPNLSETMIEHSLTVSKGGLAKARALLRVGKAEANAALDAAHAAGVTVPITAATDGLAKTLPKVLNGGDIEGGLATLASLERKMTTGRAGALTAHEADALKASLQRESKALYTAEKMGLGRPNVAVQAQAKADMAASLNQQIGDLTTAAGHTGYRSGNAAAQEMIGAVQGINKGTRAGSNLYTAMVRPGAGALLGGAAGAQQGGTKGALGGAVVGGMMTSPAGMSNLALALRKPGVQQILKGAPKLAAAVASYLAGAADEATP
jgi:hypothetical protein